MGIISAVTKVVSKVVSKVAPTAKKAVSKTISKGASIFTSSSAASKVSKAASSSSGFGSLLKSAWNGIKSITKPLKKLVKPALKLGTKALKVCKPFLKRVPYVGIALTALIDGPEIYNAYKENNEEGEKEVIGVGKELGCTGAGMAIGAALGSVIPGLGTAIGAGIGGIIGGIAGMIVRGKTYSERQEDRLLAQQAQEEQETPTVSEQEHATEPAPVTVSPTQPVAQIPQTPTDNSTDEIPEQDTTPQIQEPQEEGSQPSDIISKDQYNTFMMQYYAQIMQIMQMQQAMLMSVYSNYPMMGTPFLGLTTQQPYIGQSVPHIQYAA